MTQKVLLFLFNVLLAWLPGGRISWVKVLWLRMAGVAVGRRANIGPFVRFFGSGKIIMGDDVFLNMFVTIESASKVMIGNDVEINQGSLLSANGEAVLTIEDHCHVAHNVSLKCSEQEIDLELSGGSIAGPCLYRDVTIGCGSWVCAGAIVIPGVRIGRHNVVAAGAVVTKSSADAVLLAGVPAIEKKRYPVRPSPAISLPGPSSPATPPTSSRRGS